MLKGINASFSPQTSRVEAELAANALAGTANVADLAVSLGAESASLWILLGVATFNVVFGVWRPRLTRLKD